MNVSRMDLASIIGDITLNEKLKSKDLSLEVASYLLLNQATNQLDSILRDIKSYRQSKGVIDVKVICAYELEASTIKQIKEIVISYFKNLRTVIIDSVIDKNVIGGVRLEFPNQSLDLTVRSKLNRLTQTTTKGRI